MSDADCHICAMAAQGDESKVVFRRDGWSAVSPVPVPGWIMLFPDRHGDGVWDLDENEAARLGPLVVALARAVKEVTGAERVYVMYQGENALHFHVMVMARTSAVPVDWRGGPLVTKHAELKDEVETQRVLAAVRKLASVT